VGVGVGKAVASDKGKPLIFSTNTYIHTKRKEKNKYKKKNLKEISASKFGHDLQAE
jgi:hypothetical protein